MKFLVITHVQHIKQNNQFLAYEPYVREMNLWFKNVQEVNIIAPLINRKPSDIESKYNAKKLYFTEIPEFSLTSFTNVIKSFFVIPVVFYKIIKSCYVADHIHLRCPGNVGLLGCFAQIFFPNKTKTVKYAGNWDPDSVQPFSYRLQKTIVSNRFLTRHCKVLVYGKWKNQSSNILPFFTASYKDEEIESIPKKNLDSQIKILFVGGFTEGKQPLRSVKLAQELLHSGYSVELNMYGDGPLFEQVKSYITKNELESFIILHGNQSKETVKRAYKNSHFLFFISKSEGWPKVVAEAMFWGCLVVSSSVSCIPFMLDYGNRGILINRISDPVIPQIIELIGDESKYDRMVEQAKSWSQRFTLDRFEKEIKKLI